LSEDRTIAEVDCEIPTFVSYEAREANARLMAAAPDLLQQLKFLVRWVEDKHPEEAMAYARAAIAKAEGA
jgi:hypothetical protein